MQLKGNRQSLQHQAQALSELKKTEGWSILDELLQQRRTAAMEQYAKTNEEPYRSEFLGIESLYTMIHDIEQRSSIARRTDLSV